MPFTMTVGEAQELFPDLTIMRRLNPGGQKVAFEATRDHERVALKVFSPDNDIVRIRREILAMMKVTSPYVVRLLEFHENITPAQSVTYLLEEFIDGQELGDIVDGGKIYHPSEAVPLVDKLLQGLEAIWEHRIVHRDIKPKNIILRGETGDPVIIDFGIARHIELPSATPTAAIRGPCTPAYAPPEVLTNRKREIDCRSDLFSLGILLYIMLTGEHPHWRTDLRLDDNIERMLSHMPIPPSDLNGAISEKLSRFVLRLMQKDRHRRFKDATHARDRLLHVAAQIGGA